MVIDTRGNVRRNILNYLLLDRTVCRGDSGGGMIFPKTGTSGRRAVWQLRGLVSVSRKPEGNDVCFTKGYVIFTDVAKHLDWIKRYVKT